MNTQIKTSFSSHMFAVLVIALMTPWSATLGDDLTPPSYRGDPLSVHAHWQLIPGTTTLNLTQSSWVDDNDPSTVLHPAPFSNPVQPNSPGQYQFQLPNWIDNMPIKHMRVQLTWINTLQTPLNIFSQALDGANVVPGVITYVSPAIPVASINGVYQYYDFTFQPNPDYERVNIQLSADAVLWQTVIDTVSTVPEPATLSMLALGGLALFRKRR